MFTAGYPSVPFPMDGSYFRLAQTAVLTTVAPSINGYESAARAVYMPLLVASPYVVRRVWWVNGDTVSGGSTIECGVYADAGYKPGAKLVSGSATQGSATQVQFVDVTDTVLPPGLYWLALVSSLATNTTLFGTTISGGYSVWDGPNRFQQASASPLPATATPVESTAVYYWVCGISNRASP